MRWRSERTNRAKGWVVNLPELQRWTQAYGIEWPERLIHNLGSTSPYKRHKRHKRHNGTGGRRREPGNDEGFPSPDVDRELLSEGRRIRPSPVPAGLTGFRPVRSGHYTHTEVKDEGHGFDGRGAT